MRELSEMPPTLQGWRVDLPPDGQDLFNRLYVDGYTFENHPDGSLFAHPPDDSGVPRYDARIRVATPRFDHANWAALGATPVQTRLIQNNQLFLIDAHQEDLRRVLGEFGWIYASQPDGNFRAAPPSYQARAMGTLAEMTMPPPLGRAGGVEVLFNWTAGDIPTPLPPGSRVEMRWREATAGPVMERRVVRDQAGAQASFRREYQPLLREQHIGYLPVDGALTPYGETVEGVEAARMLRARDLSRAMNEALLNPPDRGPRAERAPRDTAAQGAVGPAVATPEQQRSFATAWLVNEVRRRSNDPLQQDRKSFMVWAAEVYGEFMRKRDGEGNVQLTERHSPGPA